MYAPQEACGVVFNVKLSFHVVGFALWLLRSALRLGPLSRFWTIFFEKSRCLRNVLMYFLEIGFFIFVR